MSRITKRFHTAGAEAERKQLSALVAAAGGGRTTIVSEHRRPAGAAIVPAASIIVLSKQFSITAVAGIGNGLWGTDSTKTMANLRGEWIG